MCVNCYLIFVRSGLFVCVLRCLCVFHALPGRCSGHQRAHRHQCGVVWLCAPSVPNGSTVGTNQISISPALSHHLSTRIWSSATFDSSKFDTLTIRQSRVLSQHRYQWFATAIVFHAWLNHVCCNVPKTIVSTSQSNRTITFCVDSYPASAIEFAKEES